MHRPIIESGIAVSLVLFVGTCWGQPPKEKKPAAIAWNSIVAGQQAAQKAKKPLIVLLMPPKAKSPRKPYAAVEAVFQDRAVVATVQKSFIAVRKDWVLSPGHIRMVTGDREFEFSRENRVNWGDGPFVCLFFDSQGRLLHYAIGYWPPEPFRDELGVVIDILAKFDKKRSKDMDRAALDKLARETAWEVAHKRKAEFDAPIRKLFPAKRYPESPYEMLSHIKSRNPEIGNRSLLNFLAAVEKLGEIVDNEEKARDAKKKATPKK